MNRRSNPALIPGTPQQEDIFDFLVKGKEHGLIEARAGSGKTFTIVQGALRLPPGLRVIVLVFNTHIAREMNSQLRASGNSLVRASTFNSFGWGALRKAYPNAQLMLDKLEAIITPWAGGDKDIVGATSRLVRFCKNNLADGKDSHFLEHLATHHNIELPDLREDKVFRLVPMALEECLEHEAAADFDDQVWITVRRQLPVEQFDMVLIDEAQDTNPLQRELIRMVCPTGRIFPFGDRFQSVYGFRGADTKAVQELYEMLKATPRGCKILPLTVTRRCPKSHVRLAQGIVPDLEALPEAPEGEILVVGPEEAKRMMKPRDLVICRVNMHLAPFAYDLIRRGIKAIVRGRDFGNGLINLIDRLRGADIHEMLARLDDYYIRESAKYMRLGERGAPFLELLEDQRGCIIALCAGLTEIVALRRRIEDIFKDYEDDGTPRDFVLLGTIHRTKGLEANNVFLLAPELIPHPRAKLEWEREQERNLAYIAATRAKFDRDHPGRLIFVGRIPSIYHALERAVVGGEPASESTAPSSAETEIVAFSLEDEAFVEEDDGE
jgi:DNA helicase-2/ATP-dependent DNA helicase PcrA